MFIQALLEEYFKLLAILPLGIERGYNDFQAYVNEN